MHKQEKWAIEDNEGSKTIPEVNAALNNLMEEYTFFSFRSFVPNPTPGGTNTGDGIYTTGDPNGTITLMQTPEANDGDYSATFWLNPHFADAIEIVNAGKFENHEITLGDGSTIMYSEFSPWTPVRQIEE